ncbi:MAG: VWA domain-containing protein [Bdellovibrionales bacterium]|nr:VWA domain-containing protein [Bdellovibrionales bacterium]
MIRFFNTEYFSLLPVVLGLLILALFFYKICKKKLEKYFQHELLEKLISTVSFRKRKLKIVLESLVLVFAVLAICRLQMGQGEQKIKSEGIELMIAVDVSRSMQAEDVKPSRLDFAKREINKLLDQLGGHKVGLIVFAGSSVMISPLTTDYSALRMYVDSLDINSVSTQGTYFAKAMTTADEAFKNGGKEVDETTKVTRAILFISDGEDNEPGAVAQAEALSKEGIKIFSLGVGTVEGGSIPLRDSFGYLKGYKKDENGQIIVSRAKTELLQDLAKKGGGAYYHAVFEGTHVKQIATDLSKLEKTQFDSKIAVNYNEYFQVFLIIAICLAFIELLVSEKRNSKKHWKGRFES